MTQPESTTTPGTDYGTYDNENQIETMKKDEEGTETSSNLIVTIFRAYRKMPIPLQIWMLILSNTVSLLPLVILYDTMGLIGLASGIFISVTTMILLAHYKGFAKVLAISHLPGMGTVLVYGILRLAGATDQDQITTTSNGGDTRLFVVTIIMMVINGISFLFDVNDTNQWIVCGNRDIHTSNGLVKQTASN